MKYNYIRYITKLGLIVFLFQSQIAISQNNCNTVPCEKDINTNPNPQYTSPQTGDFRQNTFDWMANPIDVYKIAPYHWPYSPLDPSATMGNPFYNTSLHLDRIAGGTESDFNPEDGWELIKQDFGFFQDPVTNTWNGTPKTNTNDNPSIAYFILYNKYSGILRVLATTPNGGSDKIQISMSFAHERAHAFFENKPYYLSYNVSGLLVNNSPTAQALDKFTQILHVSSIAYFPAEIPFFFYADFQTSYDPCVCLFESGLYISFARIEESKIKLSGKMVGVNTEITNITNNSNKLYGNQLGLGDYHAGFFTDNSEVKSLIQHYKDIESFVNQVKNTNGGSDALKNLKKAVKGIGLIVAFGNPKSAVLLALKKDVEKASKFVDFLSLYDSEKKPSPTVITAYMELDGRNTTTQEMVEKNILIANPGSCNSENRPEYSELDGNNGVIPMYPMYNEPLGLFALMTTPRLNINHNFDSETIGPANINGNGSQQCSGQDPFPSNQFKIATNFRETYRLEQGNGFNFTFHPIVDSEKTFIDAAIEVYNVDDFFNCLNNNETTNKFGIHSEKIDAKNSIGRYRTEFFPLECIEDVVFQVGHSYNGDRDRHDELLSKARSKAFIIFNIYYVFKEDAYGKVHTTVQTIKYPLELVETSTDLEQDPNFIALQNIPTDLVINTTTFTNPERIFSKGTITIDGDLINNSPDNITNPNQPTTELSNTNLQVQPNNLGLILHANAINNPFSRWDNTTNRFTPNNNSNYSMTADITFSIKNTNTFTGIQNVQGIVLEILNNNNAVLSSTNITYASPFFLGADNGSIPPNHITSSESLSVSINLNGVLTTNESVYFRVKPLVGNQSMPGAISFATNQLRIEVSNFSAKIAEGSLTKKPVVILGENQINFVSGSVGSSIELRLGSVSEFICSDKTKIKPMSSGELLSYCNSGNYKAKEVAPAAYGLPVSQNISQHQNKSLLRNTPKIQPNPNNGSFKINYQSDLTLDANLILLDIAGREVYRDLLKQGESSYSIHDLHLTPGVYFVTISSQIEKQTIKIIIQN